MKLFGKQLFSFKKKEEEMYDFAQHGLLIQRYGGMNVIQMEAGGPGDEPKKKRGRPPKRISLTPKGIHELGALNDNKFAIQADEKYIAEQVDVIKRKLALYPKEKDKRGRRRELRTYAQCFQIRRSSPRRHRPRYRQDRHDIRRRAQYPRGHSFPHEPEGTGSHGRLARPRK